MNEQTENQEVQEDQETNQEPDTQEPKPKSMEERLLAKETQKNVELQKEIAEAQKKLEAYEEAKKQKEIADLEANKQYKEALDLKSKELDELKATLSNEQLERKKSDVSNQLTAKLKDEGFSLNANLQKLVIKDMINGLESLDDVDIEGLVSKYKADNEDAFTEKTKTIKQSSVTSSPSHQNAGANNSESNSAGFNPSNQAKFLNLLQNAPKVN